MLRLKKAILKNARVYKDVEVSLENQGIVSVKGKNGAGKSTLFNLIESTFFGAMPNGDKKNQLVKGKGNSSITIECEKNGDDYILEQKRVSGRWKYVITKNGKDDTPHAQKDQLKKIESILDLTQKEFQGSVHLTDSKWKPHPY
jgi:DNA repair exonuclease SbcCD ATPase subunit